MIRILLLMDRPIAKWNGTNWSSLGSGLGSTVSALAVQGSNLYAAGYFTNAGGIAVAAALRAARQL